MHIYFSSSSRPVLSLSLPPWCLLFAFYSCTQLWYSHISLLIIPHHHQAEVLWTQICWSNLQKHVYDLNSQAHKEVCKGTPPVLSYSEVCVSLWVVTVATKLYQYHCLLS